MSIIRMRSATKSLPIPINLTQPIKVHELRCRHGWQAVERWEAWFAFRRDAEAWALKQEEAGFTWEGDVANTATNYFGPTDASTNCWHVYVEREVEEDELA